MKEQNIIADNGKFWVYKHSSKHFEVLRQQDSGTHAKVVCAFEAEDLAMAYFGYLSKHSMGQWKGKDYIGH